MFVGPSYGFDIHIDELKDNPLTQFLQDGIHRANYIKEKWVFSIIWIAWRVAASIMSSRWLGPL
jgi:hypothetical protein